MTDGRTDVRTDGRTYERTQLLRSQRPVGRETKNDICLFQETHKTGNGEIEFTDDVLKGWKVILSGFKKKAQAGVAIVLAPWYLRM